MNGDFLSSEPPVMTPVNGTSIVPYSIAEARDLPVTQSVANI